MISTRVLVVEDNAADFRLLKEALVDVAAYDVELTRADSLAKAIEKLESDTFDVVLLDLSLPDTDGLVGLLTIQRDNPELPVVVITGRNDSELAVVAVREGAQDYLVKGQVDGHLLVRAMRYAVERKRSLIELQRSEERFRSLLENALDIVAVIDEQGALKYASPAVKRLLGYEAQELAGVNVCALVHAADIPIAVESVRNVLAGASSQVECRIRGKDGGWRFIEAIGRSLLHDRAVAGIVVNARDITERKKAEERVRIANARVQAVIEASPLAIYSVDLEGRVLAWNKAAETMFGWSEEEVVGRELFTLVGQSWAEFQDWLDQARQEQPFALAESKYTRKDGGLIDVSIWTSPLRGESGAVSGAVSVVADMTERLRLEQQFRQAQKMEAIGRLAGGVAHDFNNLLTVITGFSQLASNRLPPDSQARAELQEVLGAADRAADLTKQLLALTRRQVAESAIVDMNTVVTDFERMLRRIIGEDISFSTKLSPDLRPVRADRGQLEMVLLNMAINGRDAMPGGGQLTIETANVEVADRDIPSRLVKEMPGSCVMVAITDSGTGMSPEVRARIFEPFFTTKEPGKGTGLGLSTSYGIVRQHGGDIWVYSEPGIGTTFKVYLPSASEDHVSPVRVRAARKPTGTETILIVEDEPSVANIMRDTLRMQGYSTLLANEPAQALEFASRSSVAIDLLLSDVVLHSVHGVDLARQIRALRPEIKLLFVSGYTGPSAPGQPFLQPGVPFLQKPFTPDVLAEKVREVLDQDGR